MTLAASVPVNSSCPDGAASAVIDPPEATAIACWERRIAVRLRDDQLTRCLHAEDLYQTMHLTLLWAACHGRRPGKETKDERHENGKTSRLEHAHLH
jgi:hypothetical protein